jgi:serine/threonine protein kinase
MKTINELFKKRELEVLSENGYTPQKVIGEGNTRYTVLTKYKKQGFEEDRVIKVPKDIDEINKDSVCTLINLSKGDPNIKEEKIASKIKSPYVAKMCDAVLLLDGKMANIEEYFDGISMEKKAPVKGEEADKIISQFINGMYDINIENKALHRDIKPANILVNSKGNIKITDLQNAVSIDDVVDNALPTRGGTQCTYPKLLEAAVKGKKAHANEKSEAYAAGITIYHALTGKYPFDYSMPQDENGNEVNIESNEDEFYNGKKVSFGKVKVALKKDGKIIDEIPEKEHDKELKKALKHVPRKYRNMLYNCMSLDKKTENYSVKDMKWFFAARPEMQKVRLVSLGLIIAPLLMVGGAMMTGKQPQKADYYETVKNHEETCENYMKEMGPEYLGRVYNLDVKKLESKISEKREEIGKIIKEVNEKYKDDSGVRDYNKITKALKSILIAEAVENPQDLKEVYGDRLSQGLAPKSIKDDLKYYPVDRGDDFKNSLFYARKYLESINTSVSGMDNTIVRYLTTFEENHKAMSYNPLGGTYYSDNQTRDNITKNALALYYYYIDKKIDKKTEKAK